VRKKKKPPLFTQAIPVQLDAELRGRIEAVSRTWGEPQSTVMRQAMRYGLPFVIEDLRRAKGGVQYEEKPDQASLAEDRDREKKKKAQ
jgi:hypothetical protein